eukprot:CAMPEP_0167744782 /NCGR_PEP_ID=MMETSP0110_2-20121227/2781_1 /TAXON_ID=629695 /ORGANISM="Gymnochlora sp., Strain CCMP2014" /LENGTH=144 /DNA_ID=CAMNT_0007629339 /DNA_START=271 /DNA_END=705 /DNA_ORIENTATION=-
MKSHGFAEEDLDDLRVAFRMFDKNNDGHISVKEMEEVFKTMGLEVSDEEVEKMMSDANVNHEGEMDFPEFVKLMMNQMTHSGTMIQSLENEDHITVAELKHVMKTLGEDLSEHDLKQMIEEADINGDGKLNYKEFVQMIVASIS